MLLSLYIFRNEFQETYQNCEKKKTTNTISLITFQMYSIESIFIMSHGLYLRNQNSEKQNGCPVLKFHFFPLLPKYLDKYVFFIINLILGNFTHHGDVL